MKKLADVEYLAVLRALPALVIRNIGDLERGALRQHEFTAVLPLRSDGDLRERDHALRNALERFASVIARSFVGIPGLHSARWLLLDDVSKTTHGLSNKNQDQTLQGPLIFAFICDGWPLDVLEEMADADGSALRSILSQCAGFASDAAPDSMVEYLRKQRIRSSYLFRDTRQRDPHAPDLFASAREIQRSLALRQQFLEFVVEHQRDTADKQQTAFRQFCRKSSRAPKLLEACPSPGYPFDSSIFERRLEHE
jgi:hypothetical protein